MKVKNIRTLTIDEETIFEQKFNNGIGDTVTDLMFIQTDSNISEVSIKGLISGNNYIDIKPTNIVSGSAVAKIEDAGIFSLDVKAFEALKFTCKPDTSQKTTVIIKELIK